MNGREPEKSSSPSDERNIVPSAADNRHRLAKPALIALSSFGVWGRGRKMTNRAAIRGVALLLGGVALASLTDLASAATAPPPLDAYGELPAIETMALSDSGTLLGMVATSNNERQVLAVDDEQKAKMAVGIGSAKLSSIDWAGNTHLILYTHNTASLGDGYAAKRTEVTIGTVLTLGNLKPARVFGNNPNVFEMLYGVFGVRNINGTEVGYFDALRRKQTNAGVHDRLNSSAGVWDGSPSTLFSYDFATGKAAFAAQSPSPGHDRDWAVDRDGTVPAYIDYDDVAKSWTLFGPGDKKLSSGSRERNDAKVLCYTADGSGVIYAVYKDDAQADMYEVPLAGGTPKPFFIEHQGNLSLYTQDGRYIGYHTDEDRSIHFVDPRRQAEVLKLYKAFPDLRLTLEDWSDDFGTLLVRTSGNKDSGTWYKVTLAAKRAKAVGYERMAIGPEFVGPTSTIAYKAQDGLDMDGILTLPPGAKAANLPLVVLPHGGPAAHDAADFDWWAQAFASRGYAVFQPNFRGSTNRGVAFERAGDGQWGRKMQTDISDGVTDLAKRGIVDPKRACIVGASYGGYAALAGVTLQHGLYRCAVAVAPVADLKQIYNTDLAESGEDERTWRGLRRQLGNPSTFDEVSPLRHAASADAPILLIHGKDDTVVPYSQSTSMVRALKDAGKPYQLVTLQEEDHWLSRSTTRKQMLREAVAFVQKYNPAD
jgi:dipeptidyl aminopeptidase/acylaminoacyl peptidase